MSVEKTASVKSVTPEIHVTDVEATARLFKKLANHSCAPAARSNSGSGFATAQAG